MKHRKSAISLAALLIAMPLAGGAVADQGTEPVPSRSRRDLMPPTTPYSGWLGIQLAPIPAAVAAQLKLGDNAGVMVRNVFKDSPADQAGLQRYDVIVEVDGKPVERDIEMFSRHVQSKKAGDELKLAVYRGGARSELGVRLSEMPARLDERELKYEDDPDVAHRRLFGLRGKILRPGPEGWILDDLGELPEMPDFEGFFEREPGDHRAGGEELEEGRRVDANGQVLHARRNEDGTIEVRRYATGTDPSQVEPKTFQNMDELRKADPEAAELLGPATRPSDSGERGPGRREFRRYQDSMRQYQDALRDYMNRYRDRPMPQPPTPPAAPRWREWQERIVPRPRAPMAPGFQAPGAPQRESLPEARFELHPDGSITVTVDDGPTKLNLTFPDEKTFEQKAPKLYERYRDTIERVR